MPVVGLLNEAGRTAQISEKFRLELELLDKTVLDVSLGLRASITQNMHNLDVWPRAPQFSGDENRAVTRDGIGFGTHQRNHVFVQAADQPVKTLTKERQILDSCVARLIAFVAAALRAARSQLAAKEHVLNIGLFERPL
nr:hypothetical protein [Kiritimatiella glycovorans]